MSNPPVKLNRAKRLHRLLRSGPATAWEIIHAIGTVKHTNAIHELRRMGVTVLKSRNAEGLTEYSVAR